ncbi:MAG: hypothetical protein KAI55_03895 [Candidatus Aenigmarchaeota archaeon]|nr:hypothetical protein [Candidatus Aenigmarchaeota archaeon]
MDEYSKNMDKMIEKTHDDELKNLLIKLKSLMERHHEIEQQYEKRGWNGKKLKKFEEIIKKDIARIREDKDKPSLIGGLVKKFEEEMGVLINKNKKHVESDIKTTHERLEEGEIEIKNPLQKVAAVKGLHSENEEVRNNALESYIKHIDSIANEDERNKARERLIKRLVVKSKFGETEAERSNAQKILKELRERDEYRGVFDKDDELIENIREVRERKGILSGAEFQKKIEGLDDEKYQRIVNELKEGKYTADRRDIYYLINAFKYKDKNVRTYALEALENIGEPAVLPLIYALKYENENMRKHAAEALKHMASNNSEVFDSKTKEKIKKRISEETDKEVKKILFETLKICGESKKELIEEVFEHQLTAKLSEDINYLKEATQIISHLQIQRQIPKYFLKGDLIALRFKVIDELSKGETKENIITKLKNYLRGVFHYNKYLPTVGIEIEIWEIYTHKLDSVFASRVIDLFGITEGKDELIEYAPDPSEKFTNQLIIAEKLKQYNLIPSKENYPLDISLGVFDESTDRLEIENGLYLAYPLVMLYTSNTRLKRGIISGTQSIISIKRPRLEFRLLDFTYGLENTGTISPNSDYNYVHLLRDAQWLGAMLRAKYIGGNEMIEENLRRYFDEVYVGEVKNIFKKFGFINRAAIGKKLIELRNTTNIQQQCKALVDKTRNNIRAIINGESINLFLELQKNEDLSYKTPEEMKDIDATTQLGLSKLMHTAIIRPDEKPTQERIEAQKLSEDKLKEIYKNNPKLYGMTVKTIKYNSAEKQKSYLEKIDANARIKPQENRILNRGLEGVEKILKHEGASTPQIDRIEEKGDVKKTDSSVFGRLKKLIKPKKEEVHFGGDKNEKNIEKLKNIKPKRFFRNLLKRKSKQKKLNSTIYEKMIEDLKKDDWEKYAKEKYFWYLIKALKDKYVYLNAVKSLVKIGDSIIKPLFDLLKKEVNEYVVLVIVKIYQETQSDKILKELNRFSINELHEIRALCIHSLMSKEILKIIIEKQKNEEIEEKIPFGREHGHPEEPKSVIIETKEQYEIYKNLIKKAYSLGIAKIDVDFMVYSINNLYWNSISRAKTSREITGVWRGADFAELETSMTIDEFKTVYSGYNNQIFFSVHLLFSVCYYAQPVLFFVKNIPLKHTSNHVIANQNFSFSKVEKIYILSDYKNISRNNINLLKETKQKYPHIEILFSSSKYINEHSDETENFDFLLQKKKQLLEEINKLNNSISKEQANSYRLYLEGIDIDIDFLIKLKKNMKSFKKFYEDNEGVFDKLKLVENKLHGTDTTFKEFRKQWDDWFPHLEQYDYFKNITYRGGYASKLSRQINEEINKVDSGKYDNDDFKEIEEKSGVEFKDAKKELGGWTDKGTYIDKDGRKWLFKQADAKEKYKAYAEVCAYEFAKLIDSNAVEVRYFEHDGKIGNLQEMIPGAETLEHVNIENLTNDQLKQLQKHSIIDWMVANQEAYARHFLTKNRIIYEIDKGDTLYVFGDKEYHYTPFNHSRYHYELNDACINGKIDLKWEDIEPFIKKAESITNAKYINIFRPYLEERFKNDLNDKKEFIKLMLERKRNLRNDFEKLYKSLAEQRQINGFSISEKKPNNNIRQETQQLQLITDQLDGAMNQLIKKADGTITSAEKSAKEEQPANINDEPSEPPIDSQNPPTEEQIKKQEEGILRDINKAIENLDKLDRGGKS